MIRKSISYIEVDIDHCALRYGDSNGAGTCPAVLGVDSAAKCFNSKKSCPVRPSYASSSVTLRFAPDSGFVKDAGIDCITSVKAISYTPAVVSLGKDLGTRASLSVTFRDHPWTDTGPGFDKYRTERPYNPYLQGTFWGKFRARQPFLRGRSMRLIRGFLGQALGAMETRNFVVDGFSHNAADGTYTITAKDALKLADDDRAQAPLLSGGFLNADITDTETLITLQPAGVGNDEYPTAGYVAIGGKEIVHFDRDPTAGNDANTKLLLHMDGADESTSFIDSSSSPKFFTRIGAVVDDSQRRFGSGSALMNGAGQYIRSPDHADWTPSGNFTFELWARWNVLSSTQYLFTHFTNATNRYFLSVSSAGALTFSVISSGSTIVTMASSNGAVAADGVWRHIAVVRNGNNWRIYVGKKGDSLSTVVATTTDSDAIPNFTSLLHIGADHAEANGFNGWIDEFRLSNIARWTAAFPVPDGPYLTSSDIISVIRGQLGTEAMAHEANDRAQLVLRYLAKDPADIIYDLLVNYAGVPSSYIQLSTWKDETASYLSRLFSADIAEPMGVNKLIAEIIEDGALSIWWDDVASLVRLRVLRAVPTDAARFDQGGYLEGSFSSREQPSARLSQVWRYFAKRNPLEGQDDPDNYRSVAAEADLDAEADYGGPAIHKIFSRWIPFGGRSIAQKANKLYLSRFRDPPRRFGFSTFRDGVIVPVLGQGYRIAGLGLQDETGLSVDVPIQITRLRPNDADFEIEAEEMLVSVPPDLTNRVVTIDVNTNEVNLRDLHDMLYPAPTSADVIAGVNLKCYIETGVVVGSDASDIASFIVGSWPVGFPITVIVAGKIQGAGGRGGGGNVGNGQAGGTALYTRFPINLEVGAGSIWGGGGGGGRGSWTFTISPNLFRRPGSGGGGGAGQVPGGGGPQQDLTITENGDITTVSSEPGQPGTSSTGGAGGTLYYDGGAGGTPGQAGAAGQSGGSNAAGSGGAAGNAIDGVSYVTVTIGPGSRLGPEIN